MWKKGNENLTSHSVFDNEEKYREKESVEDAKSGRKLYRSNFHVAVCIKELTSVFLLTSKY